MGKIEREQRRQKREIDKKARKIVRLAGSVVRLGNSAAVPLPSSVSRLSEIVADSEKSASRDLAKLCVALGTEQYLMHRDFVENNRREGETDMHFALRIGAGVAAEVGLAHGANRGEVRNAAIEMLSAVANNAYRLPLEEGIEQSFCLPATNLGANGTGLET